MTTILYAGAVLGVLGIVFGLVLNYAGKKFHVEVDERIRRFAPVWAAQTAARAAIPAATALRRRWFRARQR